jgi:NADH-quinone oxidoreductase subunit E
LRQEDAAQVQESKKDLPVAKAKQSSPEGVFTLDVTPFQQPIAPLADPENLGDRVPDNEEEERSILAHLETKIQALPPPFLLNAPRAEGADTLTLLKGIGPKISQLLNNLGIYHFDQLAALTPEQITWLEDKIDFRGRISREQWVEQAQHFVNSSSGNPL